MAKFQEPTIFIACQITAFLCHPIVLNCSKIFSPKGSNHFYLSIINRGLSSFLKWGGKKYCGGHNLLPLVEIGLTVLLKTGGGLQPPPTPAPSYDGPLIMLNTP